MVLNGTVTSWPQFPATTGETAGVSSLYTFPIVIYQDAVYIQQTHTFVTQFCELSHMNALVSPLNPDEEQFHQLQRVTCVHLRSPLLHPQLTGFIYFSFAFYRFFLNVF